MNYLLINSFKKIDKYFRFLLKIFQLVIIIFDFFFKFFGCKLAKKIHYAWVPFKANALLLRFFCF